MTPPNTGPYQTEAGANYLNFDESYGSDLDEIFDEGDGGSALVPAPPRYVDPSGAVIQSGYASAYLGASEGRIRVPIRAHIPVAILAPRSARRWARRWARTPRLAERGGRSPSPPAPFAAPPAPPAPAARPIAPPLPAPSGQNNLVMRSPKGTVREMRPLGAHYANESRAGGGTVMYLDVLRRMKYAVTAWTADHPQGRWPDPRYEGGLQALPRPPRGQARRPSRPRFRQVGEGEGRARLHGTR